MNAFKIVAERPPTSGGMDVSPDTTVPVVRKDISKQLFYSDTRAQDGGYVIFAARSYGGGGGYTGFYPATRVYDAMGLSVRMRESIKEEGLTQTSCTIFGALVPVAVNDGEKTELTAPGQVILGQMGEEPTVEALMGLVNATGRSEPVQRLQELSL